MSALMKTLDFIGHTSMTTPIANGINVLLNK